MHLSYSANFPVTLDIHYRNRQMSSSRDWTTVHDSVLHRYALFLVPIFNIVTHQQKHLMTEPGAHLTVSRPQSYNSIHYSDRRRVDYSACICFTLLLHHLSYTHIHRHSTQRGE